MYKDVCKKISAFMLTVCLIVTMVEWPTTVCLGRTGNGKHLSERRRGTGGSTVRDPGCSRGIYSGPQCRWSRAVRQY